MDCSVGFAIRFAVVQVDLVRRSFEGIGSLVNFDV